MSKKKKIFIIVLVGVFLIILGIITTFISSLKKDQAEMNNRINYIVDGYNKFRDELVKINEERDLIHKEFLDTIYFETFEKNDTGYKNRLLAYEEKITNLSKKNKKMKEYCNSGVYYSSSDVNSKCIAFNQAYEEMINSFVDDIGKYNSNINQYNSWLEKQGNKENLRLEVYETKKTYIDFNKDGEYSGKEEEVNEKKEGK